MNVSCIKYGLWMLLIVDHFGINADAHNSKVRPRRRRHRTRSSNLQPPHTGQLVRLWTQNQQFVTSGNVEVFTDNRYGIVCDDKWDKEDADVVCRQMGFLGGSVKATREALFGNGPYTDDDILMDDVKCEEASNKIQDCEWTYPHNCDTSEAAGVICQENTGCSDGWTAGPTGCYLMPDNTVTNKAFAVNKCIKHGGHLVNIESEQENHFLSHVYSKEIGPILTGGIKKGDNWYWEAVTEEQEQDQQGTRDQHVRNTNQIPMEYTKWFPGWQPGNVFSEPTKKKKERCMHMTNIFQHPNGSDVILDYLFWQADRCTSTRKRMSDGFQYICERKRDLSREELGCYRGTGSQYRGPAAQTEDGVPCMKWTLDTDINPSTYPNAGLGDHNYCRNPDDDERPWCWTSPGNFQFCDIPVCTDEQVAISELGDDSEDADCSANQFQCNDGSCIPDHWVCDMERDCPNHEDEPNTCQYSLPLFKKTTGFSVRNHFVENYVATTNETCARYCMEASRFVCRSFSYAPRTRDCYLSDENTLTADPKMSRREELFELISQLDGCTDMHMCVNGRCVPRDKECDGADDCGDYSDEFNCVTENSEGDKPEMEPIEVRLSGIHDNSGPVEVLYKGEWGFVCDDDWDDADAAVVCRMLGIDGEAKALRNVPLEHVELDQIILDDVACNGSEVNIGDCAHGGWGVHNCYKWEIAGVTCVDNQECTQEGEYRCTKSGECVNITAVCNTVCDCDGCTEESDCDGFVELVGGQDASEGRIQITFGGVPGTICDDDFDDTDATVVCKSLGYSYGAVAKKALFGPGSGVIWMDDVMCDGTEENITQCDHTGAVGHNCGHDEDVGIFCYPDALTVELVGGPNRFSGRVEILHAGSRWTVCDDSWGEENARVVCSMLGYSGATIKHFGAGSEDSPILKEKFWCTGDENTLVDCFKTKYVIPNCNHTTDVGVACDGGDVTTTARTSSPTPQPDVISHEEDCYDGVTPYNGRIDQTVGGLTCQRWDSNFPHQHKFHDDDMFPDGSVGGAVNYCRSPDNDDIPWCYTTDPDERWGYCSIPKCKENCVTKASQYTGSTSVTKSGYTCQQWKLNTPNQHGYHEASYFPDDTVEDAANHCRSPDGDVTPWCYTTNPSTRWEHCSIPTCAGNSADQNVTCGMRPLENSRRRRDVKYPGSDDTYEDEDDNAADIDLSKYRKMGRIYGGNFASYGMYPWMVGVRKKSSSSFITYHYHHCGGTIISEYWILSAAHCFRDSTKGQIMIRVGDHHNRNDDKYEQEFEVDKIVTHDLYNQNMDYDYDIALIKIKPVGGRGIIFNDYVQPACLPDGAAEFVPGKKCLISGWGQHEDDSESSLLKAARVPLVDHDTCNRLYKDTITANMACAGYMAGGIDSCAGDSGGPLVCQMAGKYTVMGVTSFGEGCAVPNAPGVYANVVTLLPWIHRQLERHS